MGRRSINEQEEGHIVSLVMDATNAYGKEIDVVMADGKVRRGRSCSMGIRNTNWAEPIRGYIEFTDDQGETEELDPLDIARIT